MSNDREREGVSWEGIDSDCRGKNDFAAIERNWLLVGTEGQNKVGLRHLIIYRPTSSGVSEQTSKQLSGVSNRVNRKVSGPALTSRLLADLKHCGWEEGSTVLSLKNHVCLESEGLTIWLCMR